MPLVSTAPHSRRTLLGQQARDGLIANGVVASDGRRFTKAAPKLYPHQWSWDSAFIAMGLSRVDLNLAMAEMRSLFAGQWGDGRLPHIVLNPDVAPGQYAPGAEFWQARRFSPLAPRQVETSGIVQPPVHAMALETIVRKGLSRKDTAAQARAYAREMYPKALAWHRYVATARDPEGSGLATIVHSWESGLDNSPRWDGPLSRVKVDGRRLVRYERPDLKHADASHRPSQLDYDRYYWKAQAYRDGGYSDAALARGALPFAVKDVLFSALFVRANESLLRLAKIARAPAAELAQIQRWIANGRRGLARAWDAEASGALDVDVLTGEPLRVKTIALFAPLIAGRLPPDKLKAQLALLQSRDFLGHPDLAQKVVPSTSPEQPGFDPTRYWRGPSWPILNHVITDALRQAGAAPLARQIERASLEQISRHGFFEYSNPLTGEPLGSRVQAWTQAATLMWLGQGKR